MVPITERILNANNLPSLPTVAVEVLRLTRSEDVSVEALAKVIQNDPALTAKILKVVNSALFGIPREVGSIKQAVVILGLRTVKVMALSFSLVDAIRVRDTGRFDLEAYWRRSLTTAVCARLLCRSALPKLAEEAFVAGLLADIGQFVAARCAADEYEPVLKQAAGAAAPLWQLERDLLGASHASIGADLLRKWGLPAGICDAIATHHWEGLSTLQGDAQRLATIVACASELGSRFAGETPANDLAETRGRCQKVLQISHEAMEDVLGAVEQHVKTAATLLSLKIGQTLTYAQIQSDATVQLAELSMQAEVERAAATRREQVAHEEVQRLGEEKRAILEVASTDGLTRVANRAAFDKRIAEEFERAGKASGELGLILMDIDHFKKVNDTHGHQAGDEVLKNIAKCVQGVAQSAGLVARYGGEEFAVIVLRKAHDEVRVLAEQIRRAIERTPVEYEGKDLKVTASLGVASLVPGKAAPTPKQMIEMADQRLYLAKRTGRNQVVAG